MACWDQFGQCNDAWWDDGEEYAWYDARDVYTCSDDLDACEMEAWGQAARWGAELAVLGKEATDREPAHVVARTARAVARRVLRGSSRRRRVLDTLTVGRCKQGTSQ